MNEMHRQLIDAVNTALSQREHDIAEAFLNGWREGMKSAGRVCSLIAADAHTEGIFGNRPMCCGVLLDWKPAEEPEPSHA